MYLSSLVPVLYVTSGKILEFFFNITSKSWEVNYKYMAGIRLTFKAFAVRVKMLSVMLTNQSHEEMFLKVSIYLLNISVCFFPKGYTWTKENSRRM